MTDYRLFRTRLQGKGRPVDEFRLCAGPADSTLRRVALRRTPCLGKGVVHDERDTPVARLERSSLGRDIGLRCGDGTPIATLRLPRLHNALRRKPFALLDGDGRPISQLTPRSGVSPVAGVLDTLADGALVLLDGDRVQGFTFRERGDPHPDGDERAEAAAPALAGPAALARIRRLLSSLSGSGTRYQHSLRVEDPRIEPDLALLVLLFRAFDYTGMRQID